MWINHNKEVEVIMSALFERIRGLAGAAWKIVQSNLYLGGAEKKRKPPDVCTELRVHELIVKIRNHDKTASSTTSIVRAVRSLPEDEDILQIVDFEGRNLIQHAIVYELKDVVNLLWRLGYGLSNCECSPPLHIACRLGYLDIVEKLLAYGVDFTKAYGICFPGPHTPLRFEQNMLGFNYKAVYKCHTNKVTPLHSAIEGDHVHILEFLLKNWQTFKSTDPTLQVPEFLLHYACKFGATKCIKYFLEMRYCNIDQPDREANTPLLLAVPWGKESVGLLIENGADVRKRSKSGETALHKLYVENKDGLLTILDTTQYLLTTGIEQDINIHDKRGEAAIHLLVTHVSYIGGDISDHQLNNRTREEVQEGYQAQMLDCFETLLKYNADIHIHDANGLDPLSKLLHRTLRIYFPDDMYTCVRILPDDIYDNNFNTLACVMAVFLNHGAHPNAMCSVGHTPLVLLLQCLLYANPREMCEQADDFVKCVEVLLQAGANTNFISKNQVTCSTFLAKIGNVYFDHMRSNEEAKQITCVKFANLFNRILEVMLKHGLETNYHTAKKYTFLEGGTGNALVEFVRLALNVRAPDDFGVIYLWVKTLLQWGANPDIEPYLCEPDICHSQSSIFLKRRGTQPITHFMHGFGESTSIFDGQHALNLLLLFYKTMDHKVLFECLNSTKYSARFHPYSRISKDFLALLNSLMATPRSLLDISRVAIYKAVDRQIAQKVNFLPLPTPLKRYLLEIV